MRRFYALGVLAATAVAAVLGLKVTEAGAHCPVPKCAPEEQLRLYDCFSWRCAYYLDFLKCGFCV